MIIDLFEIFNFTKKKIKNYDNYNISLLITKKFNINYFS